MKACILIAENPTQSGRIMSEIKFLNNLVKLSSTDIQFEVVSLNKKYYNELENLFSSNELTFPATINQFTVNGNIEYFNKFDVIITWSTRGVLFGGEAEIKTVNQYRILSYFTNNLGRKIIFRIGDYKLDVVDYRSLVTKRNKFRHSKNNDLLAACDKINYKNVYWLCNGQPDRCDWMTESIMKAKEVNRVCDEQTAKSNSIYISDDVFFLIKDNYQKYDYLPLDNTTNSLVYIGFLDGHNKGRIKCLKSIFADNQYNIAIDVIGRGALILDDMLQDNVNLSEEYVKGDSHDFYSLLNSHLAYIYIGKGPEQTKYVNKTIYDASIAKTPVLIYEISDPLHTIFTDSKFYFKNEEELKGLVDLLQDRKVRQQWVTEQKEELMLLLNNYNFDWSNFETK